MKKLNILENITEKPKTLILQEGRNNVSKNCMKADGTFTILKRSIDECMNKFDNHSFLSEVSLRGNRL